MASRDGDSLLHGSASKRSITSIDHSQADAEEFPDGSTPHKYIIESFTEAHESDSDPEPSPIQIIYPFSGLSIFDEMALPPAPNQDGITQAITAAVATAIN